MEDSYGGLFGAIPYAFRQSRSMLFKLYVVIGTLAAALIGLIVLFGLIVLLGETAEVPGGSLTLSRSLYVLLGLAFAGPLLAPTLFVARRHRTARTVADRYDPALALTGFGFLLSVYVGLIITVPPAQQEPVGGIFGPIVDVLYGLAQPIGLLPPVVGAIAIFVVHYVLSKPA